MFNRLYTKLSRFGAVVLLVAIASVQMVMTQTTGLSPWKGGGFGMFSTVDSPGARFLRIYGTVDGKELAIKVPDTDEYQRLTIRARTIPTEQSLSMLLQQLMTERWTTGENEFAASNKTDELRVAFAGEAVSAEFAPTITSFRITTMRYTYDNQRGQIEAQPYRTLSIDVQ